MLRKGLLSVMIAGAATLLPGVADAQSAIAGTVRDTSGGVLPGVTVEATSPALIEKVRVVTTDGAGLYRLVDLRPGVYTVTFTLPGFATLRRDGIELTTDFTASLNVELRVGALEETLTVTGATPLVDVQNTTSREVFTREVLNALPTGRNFATIGKTLPAVSQGGGRFDVGGSTTVWQGTLQAYGSQSRDFAMEIDGMSMITAHGAGEHPSNYYNDDAYQEMVYNVNGGNADTQTPGVRVNMVPKEGGNQVSGHGIALWANSDMESVNVSDKLRLRGVQAPGKLDKLWDVNFSLGGPVKRDRLWFFASVRNWRYDRFIVNVFYPDGRQAADENMPEAYTTRLTLQLTPRNKLSASYDNAPRWRGHRNIETGRYSPQASNVSLTQLAYAGQAKWTSVLSNELLYELGFSLPYHNYWQAYQPEIRRDTCNTAFVNCPPGTNYGDISRVEITNNFVRTASNIMLNDRYPKHNVITSLSYVTGAHQFKVGLQYGWGWIRRFRDYNGDLVQRYRNGVPVQVEVRNTPLASRSELSNEVGLYVQDSWRMGRLTLNPGFRFEHLRGHVPEQDAPAGRFVPARHFDAIPNLPNWTDVAPRFGVAYDLFGDGRTALKGSVGKYMQQEQTQFADQYNPLVQAGDIRTWTDLNGDDIAQENEIGPGNLTFGVRRNRNPDPGIERPFQMLYNLGVEHEVMRGMSVSVMYNRRGFSHMTWTDNLATTFGDFTQLTVADPRGNGQTIPVYSIRPQLFGVVNELDTHSTENTRTYHSVDVSVTGRLPNGATFMGGTNSGRLRSVTCQVEDPNSLRFCDQREFDIPWRTTAKVSGVYPLPYGIQLAGVFQSIAGDEIAMTHPVVRAALPGLTQPQVVVQLSEPGTLFLERVNQLDLSVAKRLRVGGTTVTPQLDLFNALNASPVTSQVNTFGASLGRPLAVLGARLLRFGVQVDF